MITSISNPRMKEIVQMQKRGRARNQAGLFIVEGLRMVREVPPERLAQLYVTEEFYEKHKQEPIFAAGKEFVSAQVFEYISDTKTPQGILAAVRQYAFSEEEVIGGKGMPLAQAKKRPAHILVLDNLQDPGNLGTMFRTAEAAGATGIIMSRDCVDIYNPKAIRSTMGAVFRMPFAYADSLLRTIENLKKAGNHVYAAHLEGNRAYDQEDYREGTAFLIGNEGNGLRREVAQCADTWIQIPMAGQAESLNAAVAAAILMFEVSRQRRFPGKFRKDT